MADCMISSAGVALLSVVLVGCSQNEEEAPDQIVIHYSILAKVFGYIILLEILTSTLSWTVGASLVVLLSKFSNISSMVFQIVRYLPDPLFLAKYLVSE